MRLSHLTVVIFSAIFALNARAGEPIAPIEAPFPMPALKRPTFPDRTIDIRDHGAVADGRTPCTEAFRKAIAHCARQGGGRVLVPAGTWLTGPIHLRSNVNLHIAKGAELKFSTRFDDYLPVVLTRCEGIELYNYSPLIYARDCTNIAITGGGKLDGQGAAWWGWKAKSQRALNRVYDAVREGVPVEKRIFGNEDVPLRPSFIQPFNCKNVLIEGVTLGDGPIWTVHPVYCENLIVRDLKLDTHGPNNDGVNPDSCKNVLIEHCSFSTGDDCIAIKSGLNEDGWRVGRPCENIVIRHIHTRHGHGGVVIGSDMSGSVRNVFVHDCRFDGTARGIRVKSMRGRGGVVENLWFQNVTMSNIKREAVLVNMFYQASTVKPRSNKVPTFRNFHFRGILCEKAEQAVRIVGLPERPIENVTFEDVAIRAKTGLRCSDAKGVKLTRVDIESRESPVLKLDQSRDVLLRACRAPKNTEVYLEVSGENANNIRLVDADLAEAREGVLIGKKAPAGAVVIE